VPLTEAEQIRDAVTRNGVEVWWMLAHNEGHGFAKKSNRDRYQEALVAFLARFLLPPRTAKL
jgi:dipeptidyl aminopeptidase/acylaminoacyl peptidase